MSLAVVRSRALTNASAPEVTVEVHLANGLPAFSIVGLPDLEVRESRERVRAALQNCQFEFPIRRITVNLAPADLPKESGHFDLPIALGILAASGQLAVTSLENREFAGELSLSGALRPMRGAFAMACGLARKAAAAQEVKTAIQITERTVIAEAVPGVIQGVKQEARQRTTHKAAQETAQSVQATLAARAEIYVPLANAAEAALVPGITVFGVADLLELCMHLAGASEKQLAPVIASADMQASVVMPDLAEVVGQSAAKRALEVAAAGGHHLLMVGPPGSGKSMLASRLISILPLLSDAEALACATLLSASPTGFKPEQWRSRPFRTPHHSASAAALVGGGNPPQPGEITLAHHGVLFLDELPEFDRRVLEMLREPLEARSITISRSGCQVEFPAACLLIAAMNPCPCGWLGDLRGRCRCTPDIVARYRRKLSGPLLDRIDLQIEVPALTPSELAERAHAPVESSATVAARVAAARACQLARQQQLNGFLRPPEMEIFCQPNAAGQALLRDASTQFGWSARAYYRVLKIARTIADLAQAEIPDTLHIAEAIQYRRVFNA